MSTPITNVKIERAPLWSACTSIFNKTTNSWPSTTMTPRWSAWQCQTPRLPPCICSYALCHQAFLLVCMSSSVYLLFCICTNSYSLCHQYFLLVIMLSSSYLYFCFCVALSLSVFVLSYKRKWHKFLLFQRILIDSGRTWICLMILRTTWTRQTGGQTSRWASSRSKSTLRPLSEKVGIFWNLCNLQH